MNTRVALAGLVAATALLFGACGDDDDDGPGATATPGEPAGVELLMSSEARVAAAPSEAESASESVNEFAFDLYRQIEGLGPNVVFSPYSIATALAMTWNGAAGQTYDEMTAVLRARDGYNQSLNALDQAITSRAGEYQVGDDTVTLELSTANQLWGQLDFPFEASFLDVIAANFGAGLRIVDFVGDTEGAREAINDWVSQRTRERIPELIAPGILTPATRLVLTNAIYLNAPWAHPFMEDGTESAQFTLLDGSTAEAELMWLSAKLQYAAGDGYEAVELPYVDGSLAMLVIVPDEGSFETFMSGFGPEGLDGVIGSLQEAQVTLRFPKFEYRTQAGLNEALIALGMPTAFDGGAADFSEMSPEGDSLYISAVVHEAFIAVDENGTEAAAATAVAVNQSAAQEMVELTVDRPFFYLLRDRETGALLFMGHVTNPAAE